MKNENRKNLIVSIYQKVNKPVCFAIGIGAMLLADEIFYKLVNLYRYGNIEGVIFKTVENGVTITTF